MATKKKTATKRPPKQVWIVWRDTAQGVIPATATTRAGAKALIEDDGEYVVGPFHLAERVAQR